MKPTREQIWEAVEKKSVKVGDAVYRAADEKVDNFLHEYKQLCLRHGMSLQSVTVQHPNGTMQSVAVYWFKGYKVPNIEVIKEHSGSTGFFWRPVPVNEANSEILN
jgi:hypothetical protein